MVLNSKTNRIVSWLKTHGSITQMEAVEQFRAYRLSGVIFSLKKRGYVIDTELVVGHTSDGRATRYARYVLVSEPKEKEKKND